MPTKYVIEDTGKIFREDITRREVAITPEMVSNLSANVTLRARHLIYHPKWGMTSLIIDSKQICWWTVRMDNLTLRCPFRARPEGIIVPQLNSCEDPILTRVWSPPIDMTLAFFMATCTKHAYCHKEGVAYLLAIDEREDIWRLPIGNLFDDCHLCLGKEDFSSDTHLKTVGLVLEQLELSEWNNDLMKGDKMTRMQELFSFKAKNEGFEQIPSASHWTKYCYKVSLSIADKVVL